LFKNPVPRRRLPLFVHCDQLLPEGDGIASVFSCEAIAFGDLLRDAYLSTLAAPASYT
jgi:hypothetical protein